MKVHIIIPPWISFWSSIQSLMKTTLQYWLQEHYSVNPPHLLLNKNILLLIHYWPWFYWDLLHQLKACQEWKQICAMCKKFFFFFFCHRSISSYIIFFIPKNLLYDTEPITAQRTGISLAVLSEIINADLHTICPANQSWVKAVGHHPGPLKPPIKVIVLFMMWLKYGL